MRLSPPRLREIAEPDLKSEGFLLFPFQRGKSGFIFEGICKVMDDFSMEEQGMPITQTGPNEVSSEDASLDQRNYEFNVNLAKSHMMQGLFQKAFRSVVTRKHQRDFHYPSFFGTFYLHWNLEF